MQQGDRRDRQATDHVGGDARTLGAEPVDHCAAEETAEGEWHEPDEADDPGAGGAAGRLEDEPGDRQGSQRGAN